MYVQPNELIEYIIKENKIQLILESLGCHGIVEKNKYFSFAYPNYDNATACNIFKDNLKVLIYSDSSFNGNVYTMIMQINNFSFGQALKYTHNILGLPYEYNNFSKKPKAHSPLDVFRNVKKQHVDVLDYQCYDDSDFMWYSPMLHISWVNEGILEPTRKEFNIGYDYLRSRIIIPIRYWATGDIIGMNSRTTLANANVFGISKYLLLKDYNKNSNLYGLYENYKYIQNSGYVVVVEAEKSVLKRHARFDRTCVATTGHTVSREQASILCGLDVDVIIAFDKDVTQFEIWETCNKFYHKRRIYYMYDKDNVLGEKDSPCDASNEAYNELFKNKIEFDDNEYTRYLDEIERMKSYGKKT